MANKNEKLTKLLNYLKENEKLFIFDLSFHQSQV